MNNYKLLIQYDGTNYAGWQMQSNAVTVQQKIAEAIQIITKENVNLIGSGRTDTGVHALGQVANFRIDMEIDLYKFKYQLNSILPGDIAIKVIEKVDLDFHSRFDAKRRSYIYLFSHSKNPFYEKYSYQLPQIKNSDYRRLNRLSRVLVGENDFTSFSRKNEEQENKFCNVEEIHWRKGNDLSLFLISADRFLHGMVRTIIGTVLFAEEKNLDEKYLQNVLNKKDRCEAEESVPAKGLFLYKVRY
jgi:tRNA pseudouridine38-40 synthase